MLPVNTILSYCGDLPESAFDPGGLLLPEGGRTGVLFVLIEGEVEILKGDFQVDAVSEPGAIFGEVSALLDIPHMATVRAVTVSRAYRIDDVAVFLNRNPGLALQIAAILAQRLNGVTNYLIDIKKQFDDQKNHLGIVDEVLQTIVHQQRQSFIPGSVRDPDPSL